MTFYPWSFRVSPWAIESVRVTGIFNYATYPDKAAVCEILGFGKPPEAYRSFREGRLPPAAVRIGTSVFVGALGQDVGHGQ